MKRDAYKTIVALTAVMLAAAVAQADIFHLSGGGKLEGVIVRQKAGTVVIELGTGTVELPAGMIARVEQAVPPVEQYRRRAERVEATAPAHVALGRWCEDKHLTQQARDHYFKAIELDADNAAAQGGHLGYVKSDDQWLTREEARQMRRAAKTERQTPQPAAHMRSKRWLKELRRIDRGPLSGWFYSDEAQQAREQIAAIRDPAAIDPLVDVLGRKADANKRRVLVQALGGIGGDHAALALVDILSADPDKAVAVDARTALASIQSSKAVLKMQNLMRTGGEAARSRVAAALGDSGTGAISSVPYLIRNLITFQERIIHHEPVKAQRAWISHGTTYAYVADLEPVVAEAAVGWDPTIGYLVSGSVLDVSAMIEPWEERFWVTLRHPDVLDSLRRITGQDFGWDVRAWTSWYYSRYLPSQKKSAPKAADLSASP